MKKAAVKDVGGDVLSALSPMDGRSTRSSRDVGWQDEHTDVDGRYDRAILKLKV